MQGRNSEVRLEQPAVEWRVRLLHTIHEEFDTHRRGTDLPGRRGNAGAWHGAGVADWPHVRPRRGRCGVERLVQWGICARLPQGAGSDLCPPLSGSRGYQRLQHGLRICQYGRARKPGVEGATAAFLAQFAAHAAGHDACTGFCRGVRTGASLKSRVRSLAMWSVLCQLSWSRVCTVVPRDPSAVPSLSLVVCPSVAPERNFPYGCLSHPKESGGGVYHPSVYALQPIMVPVIVRPRGQLIAKTVKNILSAIMPLHAVE